MTNHKLAISLATVAALAGASAQAQIRPTYQFPSGATSGTPSTQVGSTPIFFTPYLGVAVGHDDNVLLTRDNQRSSTYYNVSPGLKFDARDATKVFQLNAQTQIGRYVDSKEDNYVDHTVDAQFDAAFDRRNFLRLGLQYLRGHDPRNSTDRGIGPTPDKFRLTSPSATYAFGAPGAAGRIELYYTGTDRRYLNNRATTAAFDRTGQELGGAFYARLAPKTYFVVEARSNDFSYRQTGSLLNSDERRYFGGISWEATAATTGTIKVGRLEKRFDSNLPSFSSTAWEALVTWAPLTYSRFDFYAGRTTNEVTAVGVGNFIVSDTAGVTWTHSWNSVLSTAVLARYQKDEYQGFERNDDVKSIGFKVGYRFRRWLTLGAEYTHTQRDSDRSLFEYDKNFYLLTATASM